MLTPFLTITATIISIILTVLSYLPVYTAATDPIHSKNSAVTHTKHNTETARIVPAAATPRTARILIADTPVHGALRGCAMPLCFPMLTTP